MTDFGEIYAENFSGVYKYVLALCRNEDIAEEVTQETFFKAMRHIDKFNGSCKLYVWLCQIAKNTYFSLSKKRKRMALGIGGDFTYTTSDLEKDYLDKDAARRLHVLIHNLNEPYKFAVTTVKGWLKSTLPIVTAAGNGGCGGGKKIIKEVEERNGKIIIKRHFNNYPGHGFSCSCSLLLYRF